MNLVVVANVVLVSVETLVVANVIVVFCCCGYFCWSWRWGWCMVTWSVLVSLSFSLSLSQSLLLLLLPWGKKRPASLVIDTEQNVVGPNQNIGTLEDKAAIPC